MIDPEMVNTNRFQKIPKKILSEMRYLLANI